MDSELYFNTPSFSKDVEYCECENCNGTGEVMVAKLYPSGYYEGVETCSECNGEGQLPIE